MSTRITTWSARRLAALAAAAALVMAPAVAARASTANGVPIGNVDKVTALAGEIRVEGWAWDPSTTAPTQVAVTTDGATTIEAATSYRPDVARAFPAAGSYRGFIITVPASSGDQRVCVVALNVGAGRDKKFPCTTVTVTGQAPVGHLDVVEQVASGVRVAGWAADRDTTDPIDVAIDVDGSPLATVSTGTARPDVERAISDLGGFTGFDTTVDLPAGHHTVCATAVGAGAGGSTTFPCLAVDVVDHDPNGALDTATDSESGGVHVTGWAMDADTDGAVSVAVTVAGTTVTVDTDASAPHAFQAEIAAAPGTYDVCATAINVGLGADLPLGCLPVVVVDHQPAGALTSVADSAAGGLHVTGWAVDADSTAGLTVELAVDGTVTSVVTDPTDHSFSADLPASLGTHDVCATAVNAGPGTDVDLGCLTATVVDHNPQGQLEQASDSTDLSLVVSGWAFDVDSSSAVQVVVTVDGTVTTTTQATSADSSTTLARTAVATQPSAFTVELPVGTGTHEVCATAVNVGPGTDSDLGCLTATVMNHAVVGNVDVATAVDGAIRVAGWAADRDTADPLEVRVDIDGVESQLLTGDPRADVARVFPELGANTGFSTVHDVSAGAHSVCVTVANVGPGEDRSFPCATVTVADATPATEPAPSPEPTPSPAPAPDPAPAPEPVETAPGSGTTGVPAGTTLTVHDGDLTITEPGTVVDGLDIRGYLRIKAADVTVKNTIVRGRSGLTGEMALVQSSAPGVRIIDSEIAAAYPTWGIDGFVGRDVTFTRVNIHGVVDCIKLTGGNVVVEDSWLHDNLYYATTPAGHDTHSDSIQIQAGTGISVTNTVLEGATNAGVMVTQDAGAVADLTFAGNTADDGKCTLNVAEKSYGPVQGLRIVDNTFGTGQAIDHCAVITALTTSSISTITGNTFTDGTAFAVKRG